MISYHALLREGKERLMAAGHSEQAAQLLLAEMCTKRDINLYLQLEEEANPDLQADYLEAVHEMEKGRPMGYVLGYEWFYGYDFYVNEDVLIPRPETEELVSLVLSKYDDHFDNQKAVVFDVCTGSGAIGISLDLEEGNLEVYASDISQSALEMAEKNNEHLGSHVTFYQGSMLEPFIERGMHCDILVCNPPYIPDEEVMEHSVVDFEPHVALFGGQDGLKFYRDVFEHAHEVIHPNGFLAFEMGWNQGERLKELARSYFQDADIAVHKDLSGKDRMLCIELKG